MMRNKIMKFFDKLKNSKNASDTHIYPLNSRISTTNNKVSENAKKAVKNGCTISFTPAFILTFIFAAAKVFNFSTMSWFWVFSPVIFTVALIILLLILWVIGLILSETVFKRY